MKKYIEQESVIHLIETKGYNEKYDLGHPIDNNWFCEEVNHIPVADVVEVRHGRWINDKGLYRCSNCKHLWSELWWTEIVPLERMLKIMPYCPNCGAKMDGKRIEEGKQ